MIDKNINYDNIKPHSVIFHNLHDANSIKLQGSISSYKFKNIILFLKKNFNLIDADVFLNKSLKHQLDSQDVCLSFDDGLKSQFDIALPILEKYKVKAFFFIFSEIFNNSINNLELFKYFRCTQFKSIDQFYLAFNDELQNSFKIEVLGLKKKFSKLGYLKKYKFYSDNDRFFRYIRDVVITKNNYNLVMNKMIKKNDFNIKKFSKKLYFSSNDLKTLYKKNHLIGLHSHTHPTNMDKLNFKKQFNEYSQNKNMIEKILNCNINVMAHPCGKFNADTKIVLRKLKIDLGFGININKTNNLMNFSRLDSAYF